MCIFVRLRRVLGMSCPGWIEYGVLLSYCRFFSAFSYEEMDDNLDRSFQTPISNQLLSFTQRAATILYDKLRRMLGFGINRNLIPYVTREGYKKFNTPERAPTIDAHIYKRCVWARSLVHDL